MLRIHFSLSDLANPRIAAGPDWLWELSLSIHQLRLREVPTHIGGWRAGLLDRLHPGGSLRRSIDLALAVNPPRGYFPDFLTPTRGDAGFDESLERVLTTPSRRVLREIGLMDKPITAGHIRLSTMVDLGSAMRAYREAALTPIWTRVTGAVAADRADRLRQMGAGGIGAVLNRLHPCASYHDGVLSIRVWGGTGNRDLHLGGRGLVLVPSYFKETRQLMVLADNDMPPVLVYPIDTGTRLASDAAHTPLADLIGRTRAEVLACAEGRNTSDIARLTRISVAAASKHLATLRNTRLIDSVRDGGMVVHSRTDLGRALLEPYIGGDSREPSAAGSRRE
ncbi:DNA-binding transcriptional ArsR family regulator [Hamadaea flava]|uniref:ArsR family transcriptional regulator n=1 Tax=Hamadaea flava TaxID=1742688 RepID=A0ABV8LUZ8_9ACTN|nr:ArsR family transcriptional regulator [Hamadaea flava]MCP2329516.1 DNA-binding transcriptional ArsR family regulator [Hamadaea flava]